MLATKGAIFRTEDTARMAGHNNCKCAIYPEPVAGAFRNKVMGDPSLYDGKVWKDTKRGVNYDLTLISSKSRQVKTGISRVA